MRPLLLSAAALAAAAAAAAVGAPPYPDFVIGTALAPAGGLVGPGATQKMMGYEVFLRSCRASAPGAIVVLITDQATWGALPTDLTDGRDANVIGATVAELEGLLPAGALSLAWKRSRIAFIRYLLYPAAMELLRRRYNLPFPPVFDGVPAPPRHGATCRDYLRQPFVLFTDTRDVFLQEDVFERARRIAGTAYSAGKYSGEGSLRVTYDLLSTAPSSRFSSDGSLPDWRNGSTSINSSSTSTQCSPPTLPAPPLFIAEEPPQLDVLGEPINAGWLRACFREPHLTHLSGAPILCSGTTMGAWDAAATYAHAMVALLPHCMSSQAVAHGIDQSVHIMALYAVAGFGGVAGNGSSVVGVGEGGGAQQLQRPRVDDVAFGAFLSTARDALLRRVWPLHLSNDAGAICTVGVQLTYGAQCLALSDDGRLRVVPIVGHAPCALVHQYDRHALPLMLADVAFRGRGRGFRFCQQGEGTGKEAPAGKSWCWSVNSVVAGEAPIEVDDDPNALMS